MSIGEPKQANKHFGFNPAILVLFLLVCSGIGLYESKLADKSEPTSIAKQELAIKARLFSNQKPIEKTIADQNKEAVNPALRSAILHKDISQIKQLISSANLSKKEKTEGLCLAVEKNDATIAEILLKAGADVNAYDSKDNNWNLLDLVIVKGDMRMLRIFLAENPSLHSDISAVGYPIPRLISLASLRLLKEKLSGKSQDPQRLRLLQERVNQPESVLLSKPKQNYAFLIGSETSQFKQDFEDDGYLHLSFHPYFYFDSSGLLHLEKFMPGEKVFFWLDGAQFEGTCRAMELPDHPTKLGELIIEVKNADPTLFHAQDLTLSTEVLPAQTWKNDVLDQADKAIAKAAASGLIDFDKPLPANIPEFIAEKITTKDNGVFLLVRTKVPPSESGEYEAETIVICHKPNGKDWRPVFSSEDYHFDRDYDGDGVPELICDPHNGNRSTMITKFYPTVSTIALWGTP